MTGTSHTLSGRLALYVIRNARRSTLIIAALTLLSVVLSFRLQVDSDVVKLLPRDLPSTIALNKLVEDQAFMATLSVTVTGGSAEERTAYLRVLASELETLPEVAYTFHELDPDIAWRVGVLQLKPSELKEIRDRIKGALALGPAITNPFVAQRLLSLGPLTERLNSAGKEARFSMGGEMSQLIVRPTDRPTDIPFARALMAKVHEAITKTDPDAHGVNIAWIGGSYRHNVEDYEGILQDVQRTSFAALILVFFVITLAFRDFRALFLIFVPLVVANLWTLGFAAVTVQALNTFTSFFSAVLIGLGIGFSIHLFSRYREERAGGGSLEEAVVRAWNKAGPPCFTAAATSAFGFMALVLARFRGFVQLGLLLGVGVMICLLAVMVVLPLLIMWRERATSPIPLGTQRKLRQRPPTYGLAPLGLLLALLATLVAGLQIPKIGFQYDLSELRRDGMAFNDLDDVQQELAREAYVPLVATYPDEASLQVAYEQIQVDMAGGKLPEIARALCKFTVLPPDQESRLAVVGEILELTRHDNFRYLPRTVQENLTRLASVPLEPLTEADLPRTLLDLVGSSSGKPRMLLLASGNMWDLRETADLNQAVLRYFGDTPVAGNYLCMGALYELIQTDSPKIIGLALVLVSIATMVHMRRFRRGLGAIGVLLAGMIWAGGAISVVGIKLSIVNIIGIPILLGVGVDVVIHLLHRLADEGPGRILHSLATTGWAAALATATAVLSFTALTFAGSQGVRSLGQLVTVGLTTVTIAAFVMLPLGWATAWKIVGDLPTALKED